MSKVADVFRPLYRPIEFPPSSTQIHGCPPVLLSVLLSKVTERMQCVSEFPRACEQRKSAAIFVGCGAFSLFACNPSLIARTFAEDDYKDNDEVEDVMKFRDTLLGRQVVARSPLDCHELALLARVDDRFEM